MRPFDRQPSQNCDTLNEYFRIARPDKVETAPIVMALAPEELKRQLVELVVSCSSTAEQTTLGLADSTFLASDRWANS
jgi:hypothetical protein